MIRVNRIEPELCEFFSPSGKSLGYLNLYEFTDLRIQIKAWDIIGYEFEYNGVRYPIQSDGSINNWPKGFFELHGNQLSTLLGWD